MLKESDLLQQLKKKGLNFKIHEHEPLFTVEDSENKRGIIEGAHTKNLFLKNKKYHFYLLSCDEGSVINLKEFSKSIKN